MWKEPGLSLKVRRRWPIGNGPTGACVGGGQFPPFLWVGLMGQLHMRQVLCMYLVTLFTANALHHSEGAGAKRLFQGTHQQEVKRTLLFCWGPEMGVQRSLNGEVSYGFL